MSILELKKNYNYYLTRYLNGCKYCEENYSKWDLYMPEVMKILKVIEKTLQKIKEHEIVTNEQILRGFDI